MELSEFDEGWWNCFNSYTNELINIGGYSVNSSTSLNVLEEAGVTEKEALYVLKQKGILFGKSIDVVKEYIDIIKISKNKNNKG